MMRDLERYWLALIRWRGWKVFAGWCVKAWRAAVRWNGWRRAFRIPAWLLLVLTAVCTGGLVWIFARGLEQWVPAYLLYALSAYTLAAGCVRIPGLLRAAGAWLGRHPKTAALLKNEELKFKLGLYFQQLVNFGYGIFKICSGVVIGSAWIGADGIYNLMQAVIQLFQILRRRRAGSLENQWRSYRLCGVLILVMHLSLTGIVFQMVNWNRAESHGELMIFATAAFAFYKIISSFVHVAKDRRHIHPIDSSVRMLELSQAIFSMFSLQASLLQTFGTGDVWEGWMNAATGSVVCMLVAAMGVYMIRRGSRELRNLRSRTGSE